MHFKQNILYPYRAWLNYIIFDWMEFWFSLSALRYGGFCLLGESPLMGRESPLTCARTCVDLFHINACLKLVWNMKRDLTSVNFGSFSTKPFHNVPVNESGPQRSSEVRCGGQPHAWSWSGVVLDYKIALAIDKSQGSWRFPLQLKG